MTCLEKDSGRTVLTCPELNPEPSSFQHDLLVNQLIPHRTIKTFPNVKMEPKFEFSTFFTVTFFKPALKDTISDTIKDTINSENELKILEEMKKNPHITAEGLAKMLGINLRNTKKNIDKLKEKGVITRKGPRKTGYWEVKG